MKSKLLRGGLLDRRCSSYVVLLDLVVERTAWDAKSLGRRANPSALQIQDFFDVFSLDLLQGPERTGGMCLRCNADIKMQIPFRQLRPFP